MRRKTRDGNGSWIEMVETRQKPKDLIVYDPRIVDVGRVGVCILTPQGGGET